MPSILKGGIFINLIFIFFFKCAYSQVLTPPYFNLAQGRRIVASATCGEGIDEPELFCKLVGANAEGDNFVMQGQVCDHCDPNNDEKKHPPEFAVDGRETWWQSPPLSRGMKYNEINLTIDLGQEFHVAYIIIKMGNSPKPGVWVLERSSDNGRTYSPWQYFAESLGECRNHFGENVTDVIVADDTVICDTKSSNVVPLEGGDIVIGLVQHRPSANDFFNSPVLQEWTRATNIRFRLLKVKNLLGHLMSLARNDTTTTRRYFYSIKDISIGGRCRCNGHAETCTSVDENDPYKLVCDCKDNTCGHNCETCCPGFEQKKWNQSKNKKKFVCERCNCFGHSNQCQYNETIDTLKLSLDIHGNYEGGGVCQNCQHFTEGINCDKCISGYYRPRGKNLNDIDVCQPCSCKEFHLTGNCEDGDGKCECKPEYTKPNCDSCSHGHYGYPLCRPCECNLDGTVTSQCNPNDGACYCKTNFMGPLCRNCSEGYYNYPECKACGCNSVGFISNICSIESGDCKCKSGYGGRTCEQCSDGYYQFPSCSYCNCDLKGTLDEVCDKSNGQCLCKSGYGGPRCDQCVSGYTGFPDCKPCNCSKIGSAFSACDITGKCACLSNYAGKLCDQCSPGFYNFPDCTPCSCNIVGATGLSCNNEGYCKCKVNFDGEKCDRCRDGFYNHPVCEECNFDPAGVIASFSGCTSLKIGEQVSLKCKANVQGANCGHCKDLYWNLQSNNPDGCEECSCTRSGTIGRLAMCESKSGQCICKPSTTNRKCDQCQDGFYDLNDRNLFGCSDCGCDIGGSHNNICNKTTGVCSCLPRIGGRNCKEPMETHYFPTLHQYQYEIEDGRTPSFTQVRYRFNETIFPGYSWKGYAEFSYLQNETLHPVIIDIDKSSVYRIILRYINLNPQAVTGTVSAGPEHTNDIDAEQKFQVVFKPTRIPSFVTVSGFNNNPSPYVLDPGPWLIKIKTEKSLFLDYFVLIPSDYYEGSLLVSNITTPCTIDKRELCRLYSYPNISSFDYIKGLGAYINNQDSRSPIQEFFTDFEEPLGISKMPKMSNSQSELFFNLKISKPGPYVLIVNYATTPSQETTSIQVQASTQKTGNKGTVTIYRCRYRHLCRQVLLDRDGRVAVLDFDSNNVNLILRGVGDGIGIDSIIAIPNSRWSLDYVQPKPYCVLNENKCVPSNYTLPPYSRRFDFKVGNENRTTSLPNTVLDNIGELILLDSHDSMIDITGKVPEPGPYTFVVHYYQPEHPEFDLDVIIHNGQFYETKLRVGHCPSISGCRYIVKQPSGNSVFQLTENFVFTAKVPNGKSIWLHYILVLPSSNYGDAIIAEPLFDQTAMFLSKCGQNHFYINSSETGFCKEAVFTLTTKYNHGALPCQCDYDGSLSFSCEKFGGQCQCRENIIGRRCEFCKTSYFGFPNCQPCNCSSSVAICDPYTGECTCPRNVIGDKCNKCGPYTYGYDPLQGCIECGCHPYGVVNNNLQCDVQTGACQCQPNIEGRTCDRCVAGNYLFPYCYPCQCDLRGTTEEICNQSNSACFCKPNVQGSACDVCKDGSFNLQPDNPFGCTKCFCFGKTTRCVSSMLFTSAVTTNKNWQLVGLNAVKSIEVQSLLSILEEVEGGISASLGFTFEGAVYFSASEPFLGNKLSSYGGFFNYTIYYTSAPNGGAVASPDVILYGANTYLYYTSVEQPAANSYFSISLKLTENNFISTASGEVKREDLMQVLQNLTAIYVKASYVDKGDTTRLLGISLEVAIPEYSPTSGNALSVEQCSCPPNYVGLSCEECADGYYRASIGPYGGYCVPCQCNEHASTCDKTTGICHDCKHNTKGDHCEKCETGYYGNATIGFPVDCLICACPLPSRENNFATGCEINEAGDRIICECLPGYSGDHCQKCAPGYYGRPDIQGGKCVPCECNNNINPNEIDSCDHITGKCLKCLYNTSGDSCEKCAPKYFGDAIVAKNCQTCYCDKCGTKECNHKTGECTCYDNIVGEKCDRCADYHFGFSTCQGCAPCNCGVASESQQCDDLTGYCRCKEGVSGHTCDKCAAGYWKYSENGCTSCGCNIGYSVGVGCNPTTGLCECLPDVVGDKCDSCPHRWVLIPNEGCLKCDNCTHDLLDVTDELQSEFLPVYNKFQTAAIGYFTAQRLVYINNTMNALTPNISDILSYQFDLNPYNEKISSVEKEKETSLRKIKSIYNDAQSSAGTGTLALNNAWEMERLVNTVVDKTKLTIFEIKNLHYNLETGTGPQIDYAIREGQQISKQISTIDMDSEKQTEAEDLQTKAKEILQRVYEFSSPMNRTTQNLENVKKNVEILTNKLDDLDNWSVTGQKNAEASNLDSLVNTKAKVGEKISAVNEIAKEASSTILETSKIIQNTTNTLTKLKNILNELDKNRSRIAETEQKVSDSVLGLENGINAVREIAYKAKEHAEELENQAKILNSIIKDKISSDHAVRAANSYKDIVTALDEALEAAKESKTASESAAEKFKGLGEKVQNLELKSDDLFSKARKALEDVQQKLAPELGSALQQQNSASKKINETATNVENLMKSIQQKSGMKEVGNLNSDDISTNAINTLNSFKTVSDNLPMKLTQAKNLYQNLDDAKKSFQQSTNHLGQVELQLPKLTDLSSLKKKSSTVDAKKKDIENVLHKLRQKINVTRDLVVKIKVGVVLNVNTSLELPVPPALLEQGSSTDLSLYFKTGQENGLLLFAGNENNARQKRDISNTRRSKTSDFLAIEIENGFLLLTTNIGQRQTSSTTCKRFVADRKWYKVEIQRTGKAVNISVLAEEKRGEAKTILKVTETGYIPGTSSVLNLDEHSKFFIGGLPSSFQSPEAIKNPTFSGEVEELAVDGVPIGLWNFVSVASNVPNNISPSSIDGAVARDVLLPVITPSGCRFNGDGYIILKNDYEANSPLENIIISRFKTTSLNGLIFLAFKDNSFLSLELRQGFVYFQFNIGVGLKSFHSSIQYNDDKWHSVEATRFQNVGELKVDGQTTSTDFSAANADFSADSRLHFLMEQIYIGGYPGDHKIPEVAKEHFDGCIENVQINRNKFEINANNLISHGTVPGCPDKFARFISFDENSRKYVRWSVFQQKQTADVKEYPFYLTLRFKTAAKNGLITYGIDQSVFYLILKDGAIVFRSEKQEVYSLNTKYNDDKWHSLMVIHGRDALYLIVDDFDTFKSSTTPSEFNFDKGSLYFGSVPSDVDATAAFERPFVGSIGDAIFNGLIISFDKTYDKDQVLLPATPTISNTELSTITAVTPTISLSAPIIVAPGCLPVNPAKDTDLAEDSGYRFGTVKNSFLTYDFNQIPVQGKLEVFIDIKTISPDGIIFYATESSHNDYIALYLKEAQLYFSFSCEDKKTSISSQVSVNEGEWHTIRFSVNMNQGMLVIDEKESKITSEGCNKTRLASPYYVGGMDLFTLGVVTSHLQGFNKTFVGCTKNLMSTSLQNKNPTSSVGVIPCSNKVEEGTFFPATGGYLKAYDNFKIGRKFSVDLEIKPRNNNGILLAVHSKKDYLVLQMINGTIRFTVEDGSGPRSADYKPSTPSYFCQGQWHSIRAVKAKNVISLTIDSDNASVNVGNNSGSTDVNNPLYVGGYPPELSHANGIETDVQYVGCIRNIKIHDKKEELSSFSAIGNVMFNVCPTI